MQIDSFDELPWNNQRVITQTLRMNTKEDLSARIPAADGDALEVDLPNASGAASKEMGKYVIDAVDTAISVLMVIAGRPDLGLSEIARQAGHSKARVFRLIKTLEARGLVAQSPRDRSYRLGRSALLLGGAAARQTDLVQIGRPILAELCEAIGETAQLRVLHGEQSMCIAAWEPSRALKVNAVIGRLRPLYRGTSKVLLAYGSQELQRCVLSKLLTEPQEPSHKAPVEPAALKQELRQIRSDGFYVTHGDMVELLSGVCCPVFGPGGSLAGAINIAALTPRLMPNIDSAIAEVCAAAQRFSNALGGGDEG